MRCPKVNNETWEHELWTFQFTRSKFRFADVRLYIDLDWPEWVVPALPVGGVHNGVVRMGEVDQVRSILLGPDQVLLHRLT